MRAARSAKKSAALSWDEAGGLPLAGLTALQTLDRLRVPSPGTVLVHSEVAPEGVADQSVLETGGSWFWVRASAEGLAELG